MEGFDLGFALEFRLRRQLECRATDRAVFLGEEGFLVGLMEGGNFLLGHLDLLCGGVIFKFHIGRGDGLENARDRFQLRIPDGGWRLDNVRDQIQADRVANDLLELSLGESTRRQLLAHEGSVFRGVELPLSLKNGD